MRYRCFIYDEEDRLDAGLRHLFAGFTSDPGGEPLRAAEPARRDRPAPPPAANPCTCAPSPAQEMW